MKTNRLPDSFPIPPTPPSSSSATPAPPKPPIPQAAPAPQAPQPPKDESKVHTPSRSENAPNTLGFPDVEGKQTTLAKGEEGGGDFPGKLPGKLDPYPNGTTKSPGEEGGDKPRGPLPNKLPGGGVGADRTTLAMGEEGGDMPGKPTGKPEGRMTKAIGENGGGDKPRGPLPGKLPGGVGADRTTLAMGEEGGDMPGKPTGKPEGHMTKAIGENGGCDKPRGPLPGKFPGGDMRIATTLAMGEEGGDGPDFKKIIDNQ